MGEADKRWPRHCRAPGAGGLGGGGRGPRHKGAPEICGFTVRWGGSVLDRDRGVGPWDGTGAAGAPWALGMTDRRWGIGGTPHKTPAHRPPPPLSPSPSPVVGGQATQTMSPSRPAALCPPPPPGRTPGQCVPRPRPRPNTHTPTHTLCHTPSTSPILAPLHRRRCPTPTTRSMARATAPSPERPTPGVVKQNKSSGGSVDTTKTRSGPQRVRMSGGQRPIGAAKGKQSDAEALYQPPPPPPPHTRSAASPPAVVLRAPDLRRGMEATWHSCGRGHCGRVAWGPGH